METKDTFIKVRVTEAERQEWRALASKREETISEMIRAALARIAKRQK